MCNLMSNTIYLKLYYIVLIFLSNILIYFSLAKDCYFDRNLSCRDKAPLSYLCKTVPSLKSPYRDFHCSAVLQNCKVDYFFLVALNSTVKISSTGKFIFTNPIQLSTYFFKLTQNQIACFKKDIFLIFIGKC